KYNNAIRLFDTYKKQYYLSASNGHAEFKTYSGSIDEGLLCAPDDGIVSIIYKQKGEIAKVGEPILKIVNQNKNHIKTYFAGAYENSIQAGHEATIYFENGENSIGVIRKIYPTAFMQPDEFKKRFGTVQRYIIAEIVPKNLHSWDRILETKVKVLVRKKWF
ncbi:MAG: HlyD family efflux transporter periplasmic adaptor subunit, partial [bacterium]